MIGQSRISVVLLIAIVATLPGCAYVMYDQQFRPVEVQVHVSNPTTSPEIEVWLPTPEVANEIHASLGKGAFPVEILGSPDLVATNTEGRAIAVAPSYSVRTCERRLVGSRGAGRARTRPLFVAVIRELGGRSYRVIEVSDGRYVSSYEVTVTDDVAQVLEIISGHPTDSYKKAKIQDRLMVYLSQARRFDT